MKKLENRIPPPLVFLLVGASMWPIGRTSFHIPMGQPLHLALVAAFAIPAGITAALGIGAFARAKTTIDPVHVDQASTLVTTGIYGLTRNPMYVGLTLLLCAWAAWLAAPLAVVGPLAFVAFITRFQIIPEERFLVSHFGVAYEQYCSRVRRWI
jgi:protein-S-isoprenylcysteine O-methyltransferase Ste14